MLARATCLAALFLSLTAARCPDEAPARSAADGDVVADTIPRAPDQASRPVLEIPAPATSARPSASDDEQTEFMTKSARAAWTCVAREVTSAGFVGATRNYQYLTVWDMGSGLAAAWSARELGFITPVQYEAFVGRTLGSIEKMPLYDNAAFNRMYSATNGGMVDSKAQPSTKGMGWSALDHGRLLLWLKLVGNDNPAFAARAQAIVTRLDMNRLVKDGYMQGEEISAKTGLHRAYQEGRVGYEQYAAEGFAQWGAKVGGALDFAANGKPVVVNGQTIITDARGGDVMTSEPFVMMGLELGWNSPTWRNLALAVLAAQEARFKSTGIVTMVSEDAIPVPPAYFYYYLLYHEGKPFVVTTVSGATSDSFPRWVSAKAAFGYHALAPSDYTWRALQAVKYGGDSDGWTAGVFEGTKNPTKTYNLNTAAIVLESAAYMKRGCAFVTKQCPKR
ncbi:MAG: DUF3131 domain-containing protein [Gemmatimonadaceae bacterium]